MRANISKDVQRLARRILKNKVLLSRCGIVAEDLLAAVEKVQRPAKRQAEILSRRGKSRR